MLPRAKTVLPYVGPAALVLVNPDEPFWALSQIFALFASHLLLPDIGARWSGRGPRLARNVLLLAVIVILAIVAPAPPVLWFQRFSVLLGLSLAFAPDEPQREWKQFIVSFLLLLIAGAYTEEIVFGLPFVAFVGLLPAALADVEHELWAFEDAHRRERLRRGPEGRAGALIAALALLFFLVIPRSSHTMMSRGMMPPPDAGSFTDKLTLDSITDIKQSPRVAMRVRVNRALPSDFKWRGSTFDRFDLAFDRWEISTPIGKPSRADPSGVIVLREAPRGLPLLVQEFHTEPSLGAVLFAAPTVVQIRPRFAFRNVYQRGDDLLLNFTPPISLDFEIASAYPPRTMGRPAEPDFHLYLDLPAGLPPRFAALAHRVTDRFAGNRRKLEALERFFHESFEYSLSVERSGELPPLEDFTFKNRVGHCEFFASAMVVLARSVGIPTRLVDGFTLGDYSEVASAYIVRRRDAHAWVEAWVEGAGWTEFDPTPPAPGDTGPLAWLRDGKQYFEDLWTHYIADYSSLEQRSLLLAAAAMARAATRHLRPVAIVSVAILLVALLVRAMRRARFRLLRRPSNPMSLALSRALRHLARADIAALPGETVREVVTRATARMRLPSLVELAERHERAVYAGVRDDEDDRRQASRLLRQLRRELRGRDDDA